MEPLMEHGAAPRKVSMRAVKNFIRSLRYDDAEITEDIAHYQELPGGPDYPCGSNSHPPPVAPSLPCTPWTDAEWASLNSLYKLPESFSSFNIPDSEYSDMNKRSELEWLRGSKWFAGVAKVQYQLLPKHFEKACRSPGITLCRDAAAAAPLNVHTNAERSNW
ncbi:hypothetical protein BU23DRAFT_566071 [Bimuria novae-zelandiae CBS 107.79]|uniref:Uncharacterized protein n=1 Tax=Bimuria novae-zelandiae CBS 107.79 TaxID=1447943 RepID=A0A6A5VID4_9PLEO|nr:hypothetical protein BU23DRAFT_566071 [Bimuria novae-zelandiae CBS 107.79]